VGGEFSEALHRMAEANIRVYRRSRPKCFAIQSVCMDAAASYTVDVHSNIIHSALPYVTPEVYTNRKDVPALDARGFSHNLWFGAGPEPAFDVESVNADPQFADPKVGDLRLGPSSPAIGRGAVAPLSSRLATDFDGRPRPSNRAADLGAFQRAP
jgi:hypothetical protein